MIQEESDQQAHLAYLIRESEKAIRKMFETRASVSVFPYGVDLQGTEYVVMLLVLPAESAKEKLRGTTIK
jgi:hypothetical protein